MLGHYGEQDGFQSTEAVRTLAASIERDTGRAPNFRFYPAGHAFFNDVNLIGTYDPEHATKAWDATIDFLRAHLEVSAAR